MTSPLYMLDTNIVSDLARNPSGKVAQHIKLVGGRGLSISIITAAELRFGCAKSGSAKWLSQYEAIFQGLDILPLEPPLDVEYARIRTELETTGRSIGPNDLLIAAHACTLAAILVTHNASEFSRVRGLKVENWLT